ncbi:protein Mdm4 isoform 2-T2 [Rhinophrynus dorsalis]
MVKELYDKQQQHIVHCGADDLGKLLGITTFSVKDPRPLYDMLKKNLDQLSCTDAAQSPSRDKSSATGSLEQQKSFEEGINITDKEEIDNSEKRVLCTSHHKCHKEGIENPAYSNKSQLDLAFEEWDLAGLPWWFLGNLRTNYNPQSNGSTDLPSNQDMDTALVSDTTDDLWFLNDCRSDHISLKVEAPYSTDRNEEDLRDDRDENVINVTIYDTNLDDTQSLSDDTDTDITEECWQCSSCHKFNSPRKRYCYRCWALRKDWYLDCPRLTHSSSTPTLLANCSSQDGNDCIDLPDCRRTVSAPMVHMRGPDFRSEAHYLQPLDQVENTRTLSESTETLLSFQAEEVSLESSRSLLEPCQLCQRRPRNGNVVHGRTAHLVTCFSCACSLKKNHKGCPVCHKPIQMVVKTYIA